MVPIIGVQENLIKKENEERRKKRSESISCESDSQCGENSHCANTKKGKICECKDGFEGDGEVCALVALDACSRLNPCPRGIGQVLRLRIPTLMRIDLILTDNTNDYIVYKMLSQFLCSLKYRKI